jgi:hypothetical protein
MPKLAIGPVRDYPSWNWVGADTSRELAKYFDVVLFDNFKRIPSCDAVLVIKHRPPLELAKTLRGRGTKLIFAPIDLYTGHAEIDGDRALLLNCDLLLAHSEPLLKRLRPYCARTAFVEHHGKYTLPSLATYKQNGYVLWIGGLQYAPYLLNWLAQHPLQREVKILTDIGNANAASAARSLARRLDLRLEIGPHSINGHAAYIWSEIEQARMMQECKAAIDIKGEDFNQLTKPPTKAQQFVSSGIPFACHSRSAASQYFRERGLDLACPLEQDLWFSGEYWQQTCRFAGDLRERISIESVGQCYRTELQSLWSAGCVAGSRSSGSHGGSRKD